MAYAGGPCRALASRWLWSPYAFQTPGTLKNAYIHGLHSHPVTHTTPSTACKGVVAMGTLDAGTALRAVRFWRCAPSFVGIHETGHSCVCALLRRLVLFRGRCPGVFVGGGFGRSCKGRSHVAGSCSAIPARVQAGSRRVPLPTAARTRMHLPTYLGTYLSTHHAPAAAARPVAAATAPASPRAVVWVADGMHDA